MARSKKLPDGMVQRPGRDGYYADFQKDGTRHREFLSDDLTAAKEILNDLKSKADKGKVGLHDNTHSLDKLRVKWVAARKQKLKPSTLKRYEECLDNIMDGIGVAKVSQVTVEGVVEYRAARLAEEASPRTINAEVQALGCMLNWAVKVAKLIDFNPIIDLSPLPHDNPKDGRPFSADEMQRLFDNSPTHWQDVWYAYGVTGLRASELIALEFTPEFIDWENREIVIPKRITKNRREKRVPMDDRLHDIIKAREQTRMEREPGKGKTWTDTQKVLKKFTRSHVFVTTANTPLQRTNLYRTLMRCCKKAAIETRTYDANGDLYTHVDLHSLRRTFITEAISNGADPGTVQQLAGHKSLKITMDIYHKADRQQRRAAIGKLSYGSKASAPDHIIPMQKCHQDVTTNESKAESHTG
jgi:integrase